MSPASSLKDATPKALLWAYQLRKEHNALLYRLDEVAKIAEDAAAAQARSADGVQSQIYGALKEAKEGHEATSNALGELREKVLRQESDLAQAKQLWREERDALERTINTLESRVDDLSAKNVELEATLEGSLISLKEQIAQQTQDNKRKHTAVEINSNSTSSLVSQDLEKSPAMVKRRRKVPSSSPPLPSMLPSGKNDAQSGCQYPSWNTQNDPWAIHLLPQSPEESLAKYVARGQEMVRILPRRKEGQLTDIFVTGLRDKIVQERLETFLDREDWNWSNFMKYYEMNLKTGESRVKRRKKRPAVKEAVEMSYRIPDGYPPWWHNSAPLPRD